MTTVETVGDDGARRSPRSRWRRLILGQTAIDFWGRRRVWLRHLGVLLVISVRLAVARAASILGIDFEGGVAWDVPAGQLTVDDARSVLSDNGISRRRRQDPGAQLRQRRHHQGPGRRPARGRPGRSCRRRSPRPPASTRPTSAWRRCSATWGEEITRKAVTALVVFLVLIAIYISFRFEWRMALAAILAMIHDVVVSVGIYSMFGFEVTPATVVAFLTVLGYSLYDTIVVFDRVRENERRVAARRADGRRPRSTSRPTRC